MYYTIVAHNPKCETTTRFFEDGEVAKSVYNAMEFMCFGSDNSEIYLYDTNDNLIKSWALGKSARHFNG